MSDTSSREFIIVNGRICLPLVPSRFAVFTCPACGGMTRHLPTEAPPTVCRWCAAPTR
jgi:hypothetical protein